MAPPRTFDNPSLYILEQGLTMIYAPPPENKVSVDIVAVPGLGANPKTSFRSREAQAGSAGWEWLKDGLKKEFPTARVMLYEYESAWYGERAIEQNLTAVADGLIAALRNTRENSPGRPIVFIGHSMGGLVVAKGVCTAAARPHDYPQLYQCFSGCVFLGTPFRGSSSHAKGVLLAQVLKRFGKAVVSDLLTFLDPKNKALLELTKEFQRVAIALEPKMVVCCFFEQQETNYGKEKLNFEWLKIGGLKEIVVTEESACLPIGNSLALNCTHTELNRFPDSKDGRYGLVKGELKRMIHKASNQVKARISAGRQSLIDDATVNKILQNLSVADEYKKLDSMKQLNGSNSWVCDDDLYKKWEGEGQSTEYLWICGHQGKGKSKAAVSAIERLHANVSGDSPHMFAYFFCDSTADRSSAANVLKSILWQLIWKRRTLAQYAKEFASNDTTNKGAPGSAATNKKSSSSTAASNSVRKLWKTLQNMLRDPHVEGIYIVINSLHEIDSVSCQQLLDCIHSALAPVAIPDEDDSAERPKGYIKWLILSRDRNNIRKTLSRSDVRQIDMNASQYSEKVQGDLKRHATARVGTLAKKKGYNAALEYFIGSYIQKNAEDTVWIDMVCQQLEYLRDVDGAHGTVRHTLEDMPTNVSDLLKHICATIFSPQSEGVEVTKEILRSMIIAYEEPTMKELAILAEIDAHAHGTQNPDFLFSHIEKCGCLLTVIDGLNDENDSEEDPSSRRVAFLHSTTKTHLTDPKRASELLNMSQETMKWQHGIVALRSFSHVLKGLTPPVPLLEDGATLEPRENEPWENESSETRSPLSVAVAKNDGEREETSSYPLKYWVRHATEATMNVVDNLNLQHAFWTLSSEIRTKWWRAYTSTTDEFESLEDVTSLHIAAIFGFLPLATALLESGHTDEIYKQDSWGFQPLHWAVLQGNVDIVQEFLNHDSLKHNLDAIVNCRQKDGDLTPLHLAAAAEREDIIAELLSRKANVNSITQNGVTSLLLAVIGGLYDGARLLLKYGADPQIENEEGSTPLEFAAANGNKELVELLINHGANSFGSPLAAAASGGHVEVVKLLLNHHNDVKSLQEALILSAKAEGNIDIATELLARAPQPLKLGEAFFEAASTAKDDMLKLFRKYGTIPPVDIDRALYCATDREHESTVKLLLDNFNANPNSEGEVYGNALTASAHDGTVKIIHKLLAAGANVNAPAGYALVAAAAQQHKEVVEVLLEHGANTNAFTTRSEHGTALQAACACGNKEIVELLLEKQFEADTNIQGGQYGFPLIAAIYSGNKDIIKLLVNAGANTNVQGGPDNSTALIIAAGTLESDILQFLIEEGHAEVNTIDEDGNTALIVAASCKDKDCVEILLQNKADVMYSQIEGTALHHAASAGSVECCRLLLDHGASPQAHGGFYGSVLHAAAAGGLGSKECIELFLEQCDVNEQAGVFGTALNAAAMNDEVGIVRLLLDKGADPHLGGNFGTALVAAALWGSLDVLDVLLELEHPEAEFQAALEAAAKQREVEAFQKIRNSQWGQMQPQDMIASLEAQDSNEKQDLEALMEEFILDYFESEDEAGGEEDGTV